MACWSRSWPSRLQIYILESPGMRLLPTPSNVVSFCVSFNGPWKESEHSVGGVMRREPCPTRKTRRQRTLCAPPTKRVCYLAHIYIYARILRDHIYITKRCIRTYICTYVYIYIHMYMLMCMYILSLKHLSHGQGTIHSAHPEVISSMTSLVSALHGRRSEVGPAV